MKKYVNYYLCAFFTSILGCATLLPSVPGVVKTDKSEYDGSVSTKLNPGWAGDLKIGAFKSDKMNPDDVILIVRNDTIKNFDTTHPNLFIKIDGLETKLSPTNKNTECGISSSSDNAHCYQEYLVKLEFVQTLVDAKSVKIKLNLRDSYTTGNFDLSGFSTAKHGLIDFLKTIKKAKMSKE